MSGKLYLEYEDVLTRLDIFRLARLNLAERGTLLDIFLGKCELTNIYYIWRPNLRDEGDNHLVELAVAGNANAIVTRNIRDFRNSGLKFDRLRVMTPESVLTELDG